MVTAYCVVCGKGDSSKGKNKEMKDPKIHQTPKGGWMAKGPCTTCGTTMCRIMSADNAKAAIASGDAKKE